MMVVSRTPGWILRPVGEELGLPMAELLFFLIVLPLLFLKESSEHFFAMFFKYTTESDPRELRIEN